MSDGRATPYRAACFDCGGALPVGDGVDRGSGIVVELKSGERIHKYPDADPYIETLEGRLYAAAFAYHDGNLYPFCTVICKQHWLDDSQEGAAMKASE